MKDWIEQSLDEFSRCSDYVRLTGQPGAPCRAPDDTLLEIVELHDHRELLVLSLTGGAGALCHEVVNLQAALQADFRLNLGWPLQFRTGAGRPRLSLTTPARTLTHANLAMLVHLLRRAHARVAE